MNTKHGIITSEADGYKVAFKRVFNHPIEKVWQAITDPGQLKYWFTDIDMEFKPGGKMTIYFRDEARSTSYGEIVQIEPPHRFVWTWEGELAVWELKKLDNNKTELAFTYSKMAKEYAINAPAGFHTMLNRLEERLDGNETIYPFGTETSEVELVMKYNADIYEHLPQAVKQEPVSIEKLYNAPVEKVWKAITDKQQMKQWYFDLDKFELKEGFEFKFAGQGKEGFEYIHICRITEIIPNKKLQYSWQYEGYSGYSLVTFLLSEVGKQTKLRLTHHGLETFPQETTAFARENFNEGWNHIIGISLPEFLEK